MSPSHSFATAVLVSVLMATAGAQESSAGISPWTVDDVVMQERASSWTLSRDGTQALWVKWRADKKKDRHVPTLMLTDLETGSHRSLTVGQSGISGVSFSPSGRLVSFVSSRKFPEGQKELSKDEAGSQIWLLDLRGGEARPLTKVPYGVGSPQWVDDDTLLFMARERWSRSEALAKKDKDDTIVVEDSASFRDAGRRLFRFQIKSKKLQRLTQNTEPMRSFAVSPDGRYVVAILARSPSYQAEGRIPPRVVVYELESGKETPIFENRKGKPSRMTWRHDSKGFFAVLPESSVDGEDEGAIRVLKEVSVPALAIKAVDLGTEWGLTGVLQIRKHGFVAGLCNGVRPKVALFRESDGGYEREDLIGQHAGQISAIIAARDADRVIYIHGGASDPDHVVAARLRGHELSEPREIHRPAGGFAKKPIARTEIIRWKGALGETIEGVLYYPHRYKAGERHALVLITHGGPHGADRDRFSERYANSPNLYCQRGAFVLKTNYHGSSDYGLAFGESIKKRYYELEVEDMFSGIKKLVDEGLVDPDQMGLVGWSNGAILSIAAITLNHLYAKDYQWKFKACAPGAGDVNWTSDYGNCAFGASFDDYYLGGPPWEMPELYLKKSPLFHVARVTTPTIIFFGTKDTNVPTEQGWEWYRALHREKKAPVRFLLFPGEPHGLRKLTHQRRKLKEELAWFDRYLFETVVPEEVVKEKSPLAVARKMAAFPRDGGWLGVRVKGVLAPETVPMGEVEVGRFEVTQAQWASFDASVTVKVGEGDYPQRGVTFERARAYVSWLAAQTGEPFRLLRESEWKRVKAAAGSRENTLDHWAGYKPRESEERALAAEVLKLSPQTILKRVGSCPPGTLTHAGQKHLIFDVGGNVAEMTEGPDGQGLVRGGWVAESPDPRRKKREVPELWTGLRVAKGPPPAASSEKK